MMEPELLSLAGRVDHHVLEAAIDAIQNGQFPGWQVSYEGITVEMVRTAGRSQAAWINLGNIGEALTPSMGQTPERVWIVDLEESAGGRREILKFLLVSGHQEQPAWIRIRADASTPIGKGAPATMRRLVIRRRRRVGYP